MAVELLVGSSLTTGTANSADYWYLGKFQVQKSKNGVTEFRIQCAYANYVKINAYADNAGEPGALLAKNDNPQAVINGVATIVISSHNLTIGDWVWLGVISASSGCPLRNNTGGTSRYKAATYSTFTAPDPAGSGFSTGTHEFLISEWGDTSESTYTVTYDGNGNTGGTAPTDGSSPYAADAEVTILGNTGSLVKTGYSFAGWNTAANGSGISYQYLDRFNMPAANTTLYAQWKINIPIYPAKTIVAGGQGTRADASDNNGGCFSSDSDYASFQGANGGPLYTVTGCAYDNDTGKITKAASFATGLEGVWVNTREGAAGAWVEKRYWIQVSDADSITIGAGLGSNADIDVWVGGALKTLEEILTEAAEASGGFDSGYNAEFDIHYGSCIIKIDYSDGALELQNGDSVTLDVPSGGGGAGSLINGGLINAI